MDGMRRALPRVLLGVFAAYAVLCIGARGTYRRYVYPAPPPHPPELEAGERLVLRAADGAPAHAIWFAPPPGGRVVAYFHGNGGLADDETPLGVELVRRGLGALLVEYRGYGSSAGSPPPSEAGLYLDAEAALDEAAKRGAGPDRIALWGTSLGTAVAAEMARRGRGSSLVLVSPFTSLPAVASRVTWWLPTSLLLPDRFDTLGKAGDIRVPTLVAHGDCDEVVPFEMGRSVARAIAGARFLPIAGAMHGDVYAVGGGELMDALVARSIGP
jgi:pimeloyl-ACP methyl ester carboxylesterase